MHPQVQLRSRDAPRFILATKYTLQAESRAVFALAGQLASPLMPHSPQDLLTELDGMMAAAKGKKDVKAKAYRSCPNDREAPPKLVAGLLGSLPVEQRPLTALVIDEAHKLRNPFAC